MRLTEKIQVNKGSSLYNELDNLCLLAKNLYNASLYAIRQYFFNTGKYLSYATSNGIFIQTHNPDYYALPTKVSQQIMKSADKSFQSFFGLLKLNDSSMKPHIPNYLEKDGRYVATFTNQSISKKSLKKGILKLSGINEEIVLSKRINNIQQVRVVPLISFNCYEIEIIYNVEEQKMKEDNGRYSSIDLGVNNLATVSFNCGKPFIINGRPLKSINQYYNKKKAGFKNLKSRKARACNRKRENKISDYMHKASRYITNQLVYRNISVLAIGKNTGWKQEVNMGARNNQNFVGIPFEKFISMLAYKCKLVGISVITVNEAHTSKCSFLDNEPVCHHDQYAGRRIARGLFKSSKGILINADLNGSLNIMRNAFGENAFLRKKEGKYPPEVCSTPVMARFLKLLNH